MTDLLLLGGVALCVLSVLVALIQLLRTEPPRAAAILLVLGIVGILGSALLDGPTEISVAGIQDAWARVSGAMPPAAGQ